MKLSALIITSFFTLSLSIECDRSTRKGPYKLVGSPPLIERTPARFGHAKIVHFEPKVNVLFMMRKWSASYCWVGVPLVPFEYHQNECNDEIAYDPIGKEESSSWALNHCLLGRDVDHWSSDARPTCILKKGSAWDRSVASPNKKLVPAQYKMKWYHGCALRWGCETFNGEFDVVAKLNSDHVSPLYPDAKNDFKPHIELTNGSLFPLSVTDVSFLYYQNVGMRISNVHVDESQVDVECYDDGHAYCVIECGNCSTQGLVLEMKASTWTCHRNLCSFLTLDKVAKKEKRDTRAASISDLKDVTGTTIFNRHLDKSNFVHLVNKVNHLQDTVMKVISSVSKVDEFLIGRVLDSNFATQHINDEAFFILECGPRPKVGGNCYGNKMFKMGRWVAKESKDNCDVFPMPKGIKIDSDFKMDEVETHYFEPQGTIETQLSWTSLVRAKQRQEEFEKENMQVVKDSTGFLSGVGSFGSFTLPSIVGGGIGMGFLCVANTLAIIILFMRR